MALSGFAAGAGTDALQDFLAQMVMRQRMAQQAEQEAAQQEMERARFAETVRSNRFDEDRILKGETAAAAAGEEAKRIANLRSTATKNIADIATGMKDPAQARQQAALFAAHGELPQAGEMAADLMKPPPPPERDPLADYEARKKIDVKYREPDKPAQGPAPDFEWVKRGGQWAQIRKGTGQPGDVPQSAAMQQDKPPSGPSGPSEFSLEHSRDVVRKVEDLLPRIGMLTAGPVGSLLSNIGGTEASNVSADIESLAANIAFQQLQQMREASKTGGALGSVAAQELNLLKNVEASIRQDQSPANLRKNLTTIRDSAARFVEASGGLEPMRPATSRTPGGAGAGAGSALEELERRRRARGGG